MMALGNDNDTEAVLLTKVVNLLSRIIRSVANQTDYFAEIKRLINYVYQADNWSIFRLDDTTNQLFFSVIEGDAQHLLKQIPIKLGDGICGQVALTGIPQILTDLDDKPTFTQAVDETVGFRTKSLVAVPILNEEKIMGVLELVNVKDPSIFKLPRQLELLQTIANLVGLIFSLSSMHQKIIHNAERDILTGLYNRSWINKFIIGDNNPSKLNQSNLLIVMIDLNNFKHVNDKYGHLTGDLILKETAQLLLQKFRKDDFIIRYGGDEFIILINLKKHKKIMTVQKLVIEKLTEISECLPYSCSLSFGFSYGKKKDFEILLSEADKLMYMNKRQKQV